MRLFSLTLLLSLTLAGPLAAKECPPNAAAPTAEEMAQAQKDARDRGALWRLRKDGVQSYLYGTMHLGRAAWMVPGPQLRQALKETEVLAVEVDITAPTTQAEMAAAQKEAAPVVLQPGEKARLDAQADAACVPREALAQMHPVMQAVTYAALAGRHANMHPGFSQEAMLLGAAQALKRPVVALESIGLQMSVLLPKDEAAARRVFLMTLDSLERAGNIDTIRRLGKAWEEGDLSQLESLETLCQCKPAEDERAFHTRLNDGRNPHIAERIAAEHAKGKPLLAAVGLLHMSGPQALPKLLQQRGFEVERVRY